MRKLLVLLAVAAVFLFGCSNVGNDSKVKNPELKEEMFRLNKEIAVRNLTEADTTRILEFSNDPIEQFYAREFAWLVLHEEHEHYNHPLTFLDWYVRTGEENFCAPHQLAHTGEAIGKGDIAYAEEKFAAVKEKLGMWKTRQAENKAKYPQFYQGVDELEALMEEAILLLEQKNYSQETLELLEEIELRSIC